MGRMTINGVEIIGDFNSVRVNNGRVIIDGVDQTEHLKSKEALGPILEIRILEGTIGNLDTSASVTCGEVTGYVDAGGSVTAKAVQGDVDAGGSVNCGDVGGDVDAGGSVNCGKVGGSVDAGGSVRHA